MQQGMGNPNHPMPVKNRGGPTVEGRQKEPVVAGGDHAMPRPQTKGALKTTGDKSAEEKGGGTDRWRGHVR